MALTLLEPPLNRYPDHPEVQRWPALERWHTDLVRSINQVRETVNEMIAGGGGGGVPPAVHAPTHEPGGSDPLLNAAWTNQANTFTTDQTITGLLTVNALGTHTFIGAGPDYQVLLVRNTADGPTGGAYLQVTAGLTATQLRSYAAGYTPSGAGYDRAASSVLIGLGAGGLTLMAYHDSGAIRFMAGGGAGVKMTLGPEGHLAVNTTPDALFLCALEDISGAATGGLRATVAGARSAVFAANALNSASGYVCYFTNTGAGNGQYLINTGAWIAISDAHLKTDIRPLAVLDRLRLVQPRDFLWKAQALSDRPPQRQFGFVAQEVAAVFPEVTAPSPEGRLGIAYTGFIAPLVAGWQDHDARLAALESRVTG